MKKHLNRGLAAFMAIAVLALNFGLITNVLASDLEESDQTFSLPIKDRSVSNPAPSQTNPGGSGTSAPLPTGYWVATTESCNAMYANLQMVQNVNHLIFDANDLNGDGAVNLTDTVLLAELDLGGPGGKVDQVINLTDVVLFAQKCGGLLPPEPTMMPLTTSVPSYHKTWCSALLGVDSSSYLHDNKVLDANNDSLANLTDDVLISDWYNSGDSDACYSQFATTSPTGGGLDYNFNADNYLNIDWCAGLIQGIKDINSSTLNSNNYDAIFDLNHDQVINLSDTVIVAQYGNDQAACYKHYGFPDFSAATTTNPVSENNDDNTPGGGNGPLGYIITKPQTIPQVLGEKISQCLFKINTTLTKFVNGTLVRGCSPKVYVIKDGKKVYIPNLETLRAKYFGKKILNIGEAINNIPDWTAK